MNTFYRTPLPYKHPMHVVVGRPIELKKNPHPTIEEVCLLLLWHASNIQVATVAFTFLLVVTEAAD